MNYSTHSILKSGHIEIRQTKGDGTFHRHVIAPNQPIYDEPKDVREAILADPNYKRHRTKKNAEAYEKRLAESD